MSPNRQKLHRRCISQRQPVGRIEVAFGHDDFFAHGAIRMHAEHLDRFTAIRLAMSTRDALATGEIWIDDIGCAIGMAGAGTRFNHLPRELVPHYPGVSQERMLAFEDMIIGAADSDVTDGELDHSAGY